MKDDREYYRRRIEQEIAAARLTSCPMARDAHFQLAELYSGKLRLVEAFGSASDRAEHAQPASQPDRPAFGVAR